MFFLTFIANHITEKELALYSVGEIKRYHNTYLTVNLAKPIFSLEG